MEDNDIAKIVLSVILDTKVLSLQAKPQETAFTKDGLSLFRFDYKAVIQDENDEEKTVLVEVQKSKSPDPIERFRNYLAVNYASTEITQTKDGEQTSTLPIVSIYIIGFDLPEFDCRVIKVDNQPFDIIGQKPLNVKSRFVEQLTHKSYILIAVDKKNNPNRHTLVEQLLDLFIQKLKGEKPNPMIEVDEETYDNELRPVVEHLERATLNSELLRKVKMEQAYINNEISKELKLKETEQQLQQTEKQLLQSEQLKEEERRKKEEAEQKYKKTEQKLAIKMLKYGEAIEDIMRETQLSREEIEKLM